MKVPYLLRVILLLSLQFSMYSCSNSYNIEEKDALDEHSLQTVSEFYSLSTTAKRLSYNLLTGNERYYIWSQAFKEILKDKSLSLEQRNHLLDCLSHMSATVFSNESSPEQNYFMSVYTPQWNQKAKILFSYEKYKMIRGYPLQTKSQFAITNNTIGTVREVKSDCDCHGGNIDDCNSTDGTQQCKYESCDGSRMGCGDWFFQSCNYVCYYGKKRAQDTE